MSVTTHHGDCLDVLRGMGEASVDSVVTDPPYGLEFMGREWDAPWQLGGKSKLFGDRERATPGGWGGTRNANCGACGGRARGAKVCRCEQPEWDEAPEATRVRQMRAFGQWCEAWAREVYRVMKPGAFAVIFGGTRTYHRMACAVEDAGFEIRDQLSWIYGSGFSKVGYIRDPGTKEIVREGWAGSLKPAHEPIVLARKPLACPTVAAQVLATGTGALNVDATRVPTSQGGARNNREGSSACTCPWRADSPTSRSADSGTPACPDEQRAPNSALHSNAFGYGSDCPEPLSSQVDYRICPRCGGELARGPEGDGRASSQQQADARIARDLRGVREHSRAGLSMTCGDYTAPNVETQGRWPANLVHDGSPEVLAAFARFGADKGAAAPVTRRGADKFRHAYGKFPGETEAGATFQGDTGTAARFFPSLGLGEDDLRFHYSAKASKADRAGSKHPTVKPRALMRWLCRLVTPPGGTVLDPFAGSGTTGEAALREGFAAVLIEREAEYHADIMARLARYRDEAPLLAEVYEP